MKRYVMFFGVLWLLWGCASRLYEPTAANVQKARRMDPAITLSQLRSARMLYAERCSSCHNLHLPQAFSAPAWQQILDKMQPKAKISDSQKHMLEAYLTSP